MQTSFWRFVLAVVLSGALHAQNIRWEQIRNPHLLAGLLSARPACAAGTSGWVYIATDATLGSNLSTCIVGTGWVLQGGGSGSVSGPPSSVVGNAALWNNTTGTLLLNGPPVSATPGISTIVESNGSGQLNQGWFPATVPSTSAGITGLPIQGTGNRLPTLNGSFAAGNCVNIKADGTLDASGVPIGGLPMTCVKVDLTSPPTNGHLTIWDNTNGVVGIVANGPGFSTTAGANLIPQANGSGVIAAGWLPATIASNTTGNAAGITGRSFSGSGTTILVGTGVFTNGNCLATGAGGNVVDNGSPCGSGGGGTASSVGLALPGSVFSISGSPVTTTGTLTGAFINQNANTGFYGPTTGAAAAPAFRLQVIADMPVTHLGSLYYGGAAGAPTELLGNTTTTQQFLCQTGTGSVSAAPSWCTSSFSGILPPSQGGTGAANTATNNSYLKGNGTNFVTSTGPASGVGSCTNQVVTALSSDAAPTCATVISTMVNTSVATTGADLDTSSPTKVTGVNGSAIPLSAAFVQTNASRQFVGMTAAQATANLNLFTSTLQGLAPASGGGTLNFLRADGTWAAPPGGGGGSGGGGFSGWSGIPLSFVTTLTQFAPPQGGGYTSTTESVVATKSPTAATLSNLQVTLSAATGGSTSLIITLEDGLGNATALTCTIVSPALTCASTASVTVAAGDLLSWKLVSSALVTNGLPEISIQYAVGTSQVGVTNILTTGPISGGPITGSGTISCPTCATAASQPTGLAHLTSSSQALTASLLATADIGANVVTGPKLAVVQTYRSCDIAIGDAASSTVLTNSQLGSGEDFLCYIPAAATVVEVDAYTNGTGLSFMVAYRNPSSGTSTNLLTSNLTAAVGVPIACSNTSGTSIWGGTCSTTLTNTAISSPAFVRMNGGTAGGVATYVSIHILYTVN